MPRISQVNWPKLNIRYGWVFDIQSPDELLDWWEHVHRSISVESFQDALQASKGVRHARSGEALLVLAGIWETDLVSALGRYEGDRLQGMMGTLQDWERLFINRNGGYFPYMPDLYIVSTREVDLWTLPDETLRILQWPKGRHYYAKIGNEDVIVDGKMKWDSYAEAELASKKFVAIKEALNG